MHIEKPHVPLRQRRIALSHEIERQRVERLQLADRRRRRRTICLIDCIQQPSVDFTQSLTGIDVQTPAGQRPRRQRTAGGELERTGSDSDGVMDCGYIYRLANNLLIGRRRNLSTVWPLAESSLTDGGPRTAVERLSTVGHTCRCAQTANIRIDALH